MTAFFRHKKDGLRIKEINNLDSVSFCPSDEYYSEWICYGSKECTIEIVTDEEWYLCMVCDD